MKSEPVSKGIDLATPKKRGPFALEHPQKIKVSGSGRAARWCRRSTALGRPKGRNSHRVSSTARLNVITFNEPENGTTPSPVLESASPVAALPESLTQSLLQPLAGPDSEPVPATTDGGTPSP